MSRNEVVAGSVAGMVTKCFEHPMDTIKVQLQTQPSAPRSSVVSLVVDLCRRHGALALYRGLALPLCAAAGENSVLFYSYALAASALDPGARDDERPLGTVLAASTFAAVAVSFLLTPVELVKVRLQSTLLGTGEGARSSPLDCAARCLRARGVVGLYRGHAAMLLREVPGNATSGVPRQELLVSKLRLEFTKRK